MKRGDFGAFCASRLACNATCALFHVLEQQRRFKRSLRQLQSTRKGCDKLRRRAVDFCKVVVDFRKVAVDFAAKSLPNEGSAERPT
jgi:hypothetical protein